VQPQAIIYKHKPLDAPVILSNPGHLPSLLGVG